MKKEVSKEFVICRCGYYIIEGIETGLFETTKDIEQATPFPTVDNTVSYVENDLHLNIENVDIHKVTHFAPEVTPLVFKNGRFIDIQPIEFYYYEDYIDGDEDELKQWIAEFVPYVGEEQLLRIQENEIGYIETLDELKKWCEDNGEDFEDYIEEVTK